MNSYKLLVCHEAPHNGKVYYVSGDQRKWIRSGEHMEYFKFDWNAVTAVTSEQLSQYKLSAPAARSINFYNQEMSLWEIHEMIGSQLSGVGVEFGAASNPFPCNINSSVIYADIFDHQKEDSPYFSNTHYSGTDREFTTVSYQTGMEKMDNIQNESLDFIIACHVIEHLKNPIRAIEVAWQKLKTGGRLVLLVSHHDLTFDKNRKLTTIDHLILDYKRPLKERDFLHYVDFYEHAFPHPNPFSKALEESINPFSDIHFHTWTENTFNEMVHFIDQNIVKWSKVNYYPPLQIKEANEFYFILQK